MLGDSDEDEDEEGDEAAKGDDEEQEDDGEARDPHRIMSEEEIQDEIRRIRAIAEQNARKGKKKQKALAAKVTTYLNMNRHDTYIHNTHLNRYIQYVHRHTYIQYSYIYIPT